VQRALSDTRKHFRELRPKEKPLKKAALAIINFVERPIGSYFMVGITKSAPERIPVGQRVVIVFSFV